VNEPRDVADAGLEPIAACEATCILALRASSLGDQDEARAWLHALGMCPTRHLVGASCAMPAR
jgi:hypothetical protein